jgi:predicted porin
MTLNSKFVWITLAGVMFVGENVQAQSNVTVYGLLDTAVEYSKQGNGGLTRLQPGSFQGNRIGFRGTEDLGGGLNALFVLENGFTLDNGNLAQGGRLFGRQAFVGLKNQLGTVALGRQYSPYYLSMLQQDAFQWTMVGGLPAITRTTGAAAATGLLLTGYQNIGRVDNTITYASPNLGGFTGNLMYGFGEVAGDSGAGRVVGASVRYAAGIIDLNVGYTEQNDAFDRGSLKAMNAGGNVTIGPAKVYAGYIREENTSATSATAALPSAKFDLYNVGVRYNVTGSLVAIAQAAHIRDRSAGLTVDRDATVYAIGAEYNLSKRSLVYSSFGTVGNRNGSNYSLGSGTALGGPAAGNERARTINVGIKHVF